MLVVFLLANYGNSTVRFIRLIVQDNVTYNCLWLMTRHQKSFIAMQRMKIEEIELKIDQVFLKNEKSYFSLLSLLAPLFYLSFIFFLLASLFVSFFFSSCCVSPVLSVTIIGADRLSVIQDRNSNGTEPGA